MVRRGRRPSIEHADGIARVLRCATTASCSAASTRRSSESTTSGTRWRRSPSAARSAFASADLVAGVRGFKGIKRRLEDGRRPAGTSRCWMTSRITRLPFTKLCQRLRTGYPSRRIWAVFEPRSASSCRRVFQEDFAARVRRRRRSRDRRRVPKSSLPESERLSAEQLVDDLRAQRTARSPHSRGRRHRPHASSPSIARVTSSC